MVSSGAFRGFGSSGVVVLEFRQLGLGFEVLVWSGFLVFFGEDFNGLSS